MAKHYEVCEPDPATTVLGGTSFVTTAPALVSDVYLAWRKNAALSPAAAALVAAVRDGVDGD